MKKKLNRLIRKAKKLIKKAVEVVSEQWELLLIDLKNKRITNRVRVFFASLSVLVLVIVGIVLIINANKSNNAGEEESITDSVTEDTDESFTDENEDAILYDTENSGGETESVDGTISDSAGGLLPETDDAGEQYVNDTLFIGDSNTVRMMNYGLTSLENTIAVVGMGIQSVKTLKCVQFSGYGSPVTMIDAVKLMQPRRIIITFGTNNANGMDVDTFIGKYEEALSAIHEAYPYADILINSIPPIALNNSYPTLKQDNIDSFNNALLKLSSKLGYKFIDSASVMKDRASGHAKNGYTVSDGIHISEEGFAAMFTYIRTHHSMVLSDKRPKPLKDIPKQVKATYVIDSSGKMNNDPTAYSKMSEVSKEQQEALKKLQEAALKAAQEALIAEQKKLTPTPTEVNITPTPTPKQEAPTQDDKKNTPTPTPKKEQAEVTPTPKPVEPTEAPKPAEPTPTPKPAEPTEAPKPAEPTEAPKPEQVAPTPTPVPQADPTPTPVPELEPTPTPTPEPEPEPEPTPTPTPEPAPQEEAPQDSENAQSGE